MASISRVCAEGQQSTQLPANQLLGGTAVGRIFNVSTWSCDCNLGTAQSCYCYKL